MLEITIPGRAFWNKETEEFVYTEDTVLQLEHSLLSLTEWERTWRKPFLSKEPKTYEEDLDYVRCMMLGEKKIDPLVLRQLTSENQEQIAKYIEQEQTATTFNDRSGSKGGRRIATSEVIYSQMVSLRIPFDPCAGWHLSSLLTLIRVCSLESNPGKKMSPKEVMRQNSSLNEQRRKALGTRG